MQGCASGQDAGFRVYSHFLPVLSPRGKSLFNASYSLGSEKIHMRTIFLLTIAAFSTSLLMTSPVDADDRSKAGVLIKPLLVSDPPSFLRAWGSDVDRVESADFDGDGTDDFLVVTKLPPGSRLSHRYTLVTSLGKVLAKRDFFRTPVWFYWFVNLDEDPLLEFILYSGYEDGADFVLFDVDETTTSLEKRLTFLPVLRSKQQSHGPYVWAIARELEEGNRFFINRKNQLECSFDYDPKLLLYEDAAPRPPQTILPVLVLQSDITLEGPGLPINPVQRLTLEQIVRRSRESRQ